MEQAEEPEKHLGCVGRRRTDHWHHIASLPIFRCLKTLPVHPVPTFQLRGEATRRNKERRIRQTAVVGYNTSLCKQAQALTDMCDM